MPIMCSGGEGCWLSSSEHRIESYRVHLQSLTNEFLGQLYLVFSLRLNISREF